MVSYWKRSEEGCDIRIFETTDYVGQLRQLCRDGHTVSCKIIGGSMVPFFADGRDSVILCAPDRPLRCGDIVFYQRDNGAFILHRIMRICPDGTYDMAGDSQSEIECGIRPEQIFAIAKEAVRRGKHITPRTLVWRFFAVIWCRPMLIPHRRWIIAVWSRLKKTRTRGCRKFT